MLDFSTIQAYPSSNTFVAKANSISAFTEIIPGLKYTIRRGIITSRFIVGFTIEKPKSGVSTYSDSVRDDSAESISVIAPEGAKYIYGYVFNPSYDSVDTRDSVIQSIQIIQPIILLVQTVRAEENNDYLRTFLENIGTIRR